MTDQELSEIAGYDSNWLAEIKWRNPRKYKLLKKMKPWNYADYDLKLRTRLGEIYYEIREDPDMTLSEFWDLYLRSIITSKHAFMMYIKTMAFNNTEASTRLTAVKRMQYIVKSYSKYKELKDGTKDKATA